MHNGSMIKHKQWQKKWFETMPEARAFAKSINDIAYGIDIRRVNRANKTYTNGFIVEWYER